MIGRLPAIKANIPIKHIVEMLASGKMLVLDSVLMLHGTRMASPNHQGNNVLGC